ncbi:hypothetical protein, variant [Cryptococcus amylolentus CBS 6039]|uniref:Uncharacterized protein n=1 Tax=Cryptococcus amylolentus CBS 6039 TaxID=1295533 RepID=A0A1E3HDT3_9TREE|nr:hypothetical protein, variant [Cryptococcus amylolentus CBS 6039]ODN74498.1 hypothetical protein, variant [Cryptococcus amylolentus CBS 6039]
MDDDFEDLLRDETYEEQVDQSALKRDIPEPSVVTQAAPSSNEIRLGRRVLELEKERDSLATELQALKSRLPTHANPTVPIQHPSASSAPETDQPVDIPPHLLPLLNTLRTHIAELTRDIQALRQTFLGQAVPRRGPISQVATPITAQTATMPNALVPPVAAGIVQEDEEMDALPEVGTSEKLSPHPALAPSRESAAGLDLERVLETVKMLVQENEELGEMVLEAGRGSGSDWQTSLDESKAVIESLDSDLSHHLSVVQTTRAELEAFQNHFGPLPFNITSNAAAHPNAIAPSGTPTALRGLPSFVGRPTPTGPSAAQQGRGPRPFVPKQPGQGQGQGIGRGGKSGFQPAAGVRRPFSNGPGNGSGFSLGNAPASGKAGGDGPTTGHIRGGSAGQGQSLRQDERGFKRRK